jgi:hypothetical protein
MDKDVCLQRALRIRYAFPRIQWLIGVISAVSLIYLTSEELWKILDSESPSGITPESFALYLVFFTTLLLVAHVYDTRRLVGRISTILLVSVISIGVDILFICIAEFVVLTAICVYPQNYLDGAVILLLGAMPASLGSVILSSLTGEILKERARKMYEEVKGMREVFESLEDKRKIASEALEELKKKKTEFDKKMEKENQRQNETDR